MKTPFAILCCALAASAAASPSPSAEIKAGITAAVERYASAVACPGAHVLADQVVALRVEEGGESLPMYAALWTGDLGCQGGSQTAATHLAIATIDSGRYVVQPELSSPVVAFESPVRFVERVAGHDAATLVLEGKEYRDGDARSTPSRPVRFTLRRDERGGWKLVDKASVAVGR